MTTFLSTVTNILMFIGLPFQQSLIFQMSFYNNKFLWFLCLAKHICKDTQVHIVNCSCKLFVCNLQLTVCIYMYLCHCKLVHWHFSFRKSSSENGHHFASWYFGQIFIFVFSKSQIPVVLCVKWRWLFFWLWWIKKLVHSQILVLYCSAFW